MSAIGVYLRGLRQGRQWNREAVARQTGFTADKIRRDEDGLSMPSFADQRVYARVFGFKETLEFMEGWRGGKVELSRGERQGKVPIINRVPAGRPVDYEEYGVDSGLGYDYAERPPGFEGENLFAFVVVGDSMSPAYVEGDLVYCRPVELNEPMSDGAAVFVRFGAERDNTCTFKRIYGRGDKVDLKPINPLYHAQAVRREEIVSLAVVVHVRRREGQSIRRYVADGYAQDFSVEE